MTAATTIGLFEIGDRVELVLPSRGGILPTGIVGTVDFVEEDWVYWRSDEGPWRCSKPDAVRRIRR